jgi:hypothetical protein
VNEDLRTYLTEREGAGAPDAARCAGDQGGFTRKTVHDQISFANTGLEAIEFMCIGFTRTGT